MPTVYIETSVPSYYVSWPSLNVIVLAHQMLTRQWWDTRLGDFDAYVSPVVIEEASLGDSGQAQKRLELLRGLPVLAATEQVERLAEAYLASLSLPEKAIRDAAHLAFACHYGLDFLVTWNCAHIANAEVVKRLNAFNSTNAVATPIICTPEELLGKQEADI